MTALPPAIADAFAQQAGLCRLSSSRLVAALSDVTLRLRCLGLTVDDVHVHAHPHGSFVQWL